MACDNAGGCGPNSPFTLGYCVEYGCAPGANFRDALRTNTSPADFDLLLDDVTTKLFDRYDDATIVWPGHGDPTTLGAERPHLDAWRARRW